MDADEIISGAIYYTNGFAGGAAAPAYDDFSRKHRPYFFDTCRFLISSTLDDFIFSTDTTYICHTRRLSINYRCNSILQSTHGCQYPRLQQTVGNLPYQNLHSEHDNFEGFFEESVTDLRKIGNKLKMKELSALFQSLWIVHMKKN